MNVRTKIVKNVPMNAAATAERLIAREETRLRSRMRAYEWLGSQISRSTDWVRGLVTRGVGVVNEEILTRFDELLISGLEADIARLKAELEVARSRRRPTDLKRIGQIEAHLHAAKALLPDNTSRHMDEG